jgi:protein-S-isoprenylcysteine O-methyltransferase Ste14
MLKNKIPPPVYMLITAAMMWLLDKFLPLYNWLNNPWNKQGLIIIGIAAFLDIWSLLLFFQFKTTPNPMKLSNTSHLVTNGLYRYSRNPMYLGLLVMLIGWAFYLGSLSPLSMLPLFIWLLTNQQIIPEETILMDKFGQEYKDYQKHVRRWI